MNSSSTELDRFVHTLISPLTALQGALGLLRRTKNDEQRSALLLTTIERNIERLRIACNQILDHAYLIDDQIRVELPANLAGTAPNSLGTTIFQTHLYAPPEHGTKTHTNHHHSLPVQAATILFLVRIEIVPLSLIQALEERNHHLVWAKCTSDGIDIARELRPNLIILDPHSDDHAHLASQIFNEDPETKMIPLLQINDESDLSDSGKQQVSWLLEQIDNSLDSDHHYQRAMPHILIVDDEPDIAYLIATQFTNEGYLTTVVGSGTEVLQIVREQQFDLILLDLLLPDIDGFTVLGGLRVQPETQLTPIILLSAINSPADKVRGLQLGADDYITKPFSDVELNARVQAAMRRSEREGGANPSTRLPGNLAIERAISRRINQHDNNFAVCYCDLDNFKAYNDTYGFLKGDAVIQRTAQILLDTVREFGNLDDFVGHIGGDDFVIITSLDRLDSVCSKVIEQFDATVPLLYDREARTRGFISGYDRQGRPTMFPLLSISIIAISSRCHLPSHPGEVAQRSVEPKKRAKFLPGSVLIIDE